GCSGPHRRRAGRGMVNDREGGFCSAPARERRTPAAARVLRVASPFIAVLALLCATTSPCASTSRHAAIVVDANSRRVLYQDQPDAQRSPASLTKLMTLYVLFERIEQGRLSYQSKLTFSANAVAQAPSKLDLDAGSEMTVLDAIRLLITKSANDVAVAIAERIAGSE